MPVAATGAPTASPSAADSATERSAVVAGNTGASLTPLMVFETVVVLDSDGLPLSRTR